MRTIKQEQAIDIHTESLAWFDGMRIVQEHITDFLIGNLILEGLL